MCFLLLFLGLAVMGYKHVTQSRSENFRDKKQAKANNMTHAYNGGCEMCTLCQPTTSLTT